jgi:DNA-binding IclR family transcriptional regulator
MRKISIMEHKPTLRVLEILEALAAENKGMSLTKLSEKTGSLKGTIFPILKTLVEKRYVSYEAAAQLYSPGIACSMLSRSFLDRSFWLTLVYNEMSDMVKQCNEVCQMGILDGADVLYINKVQAEQTVQLASHIGTRLPAIFSALGKSLICEYSDEQIRKWYPDGFTPLTPYSTRSVEALREQLEDVKIRGYSVDNREINEETICCAIPLKQRNKTIAALSISIPVFRATETKREETVYILLAARARIEKALGAMPDVNFYQ